MQLEPLGDKAILITIDGGIDQGTLDLVRTVVARIAGAGIEGITDIVAGYASVAVHYEPLVIPGALIRARLQVLLGSAGDGAEVAESRTVDIPVRYGGEDGPDLEALAAVHGIAADEVVALHSGVTYVVHMIGFVPGFPYLGGLDSRLATPRLELPRTAVPAGSVGIGGSQTGVYPIESPGGWNLIGRTPLQLFDPMREPPALLRVGDRVRFVAAPVT